jgi:hypothetical protein
LDDEESPPLKQIPSKRKKQEKMTKGKKHINVNIIFDKVDMLWQEIFKSDATLDFSDPQIIHNFFEFTKNLTESARQK